ncbi:dimethylarginine dimethylaminohydrolase family protein [Rhodohalobacter halophilus]|uniref:dimethylarginine dimethylaminohydrolase family protein n=1 Tax=Rhodohalobacter halophilus TaxID=1812810 RepID=UPI00083FCC27|nr:arginine deiminase family protein [Rhodohalobacter halophilus]
MKKIYTSAAQIDFTLSDIPSMPAPKQVLTVKPTYFDVEYVINPHMKDHVGRVDKMQAQNEWEHLVDGYEELGFTVHKLDGVQGLPDMVFCANQSLPFIDENGKKKVLMSIMHSAERKDEVPHIEKFYRQMGYEIDYLDSSEVDDFEGMGDALWHFKKRLLWGGYGFRSSLKAYDQISDKLNTPVVALELTDDKFYHLDTCMAMLNENSVLIYPDAFQEEGLEMIYKLFDNVIEATQYEAEKLFAVNATCPDGKNVLIQQGCTDVNQKLRDAGFSVHEYSTFEYIKSGGSVFCMKMLLW